MAKWTVTFEDVGDNEGVTCDFKLVEGVPVLKDDGDNEGWTPATCCALNLAWLWDTEQFQEQLKAQMTEVATYHLSRKKSAEG